MAVKCPKPPVKYAAVNVELSALYGLESPRCIRSYLRMRKCFSWCLVKGMAKKFSKSKIHEHVHQPRPEHFLIFRTKKTNKKSSRWLITTHAACIDFTALILFGGCSSFIATMGYVSMVRASSVQSPWALGFNQIWRDVLRKMQELLVVARQ